MASTKKIEEKGKRESPWMKAKINKHKKLITNGIIRKTWKIHSLNKIPLVLLNKLKD